MTLKTLAPTLAFAALGSLLCAPAQAQITEGWTGEASLSGSKTTGNTETTDLGLALAVQKAGETWRHKFKASGDLGRVDGVTSQRRYRLGYQIDRDITDRVYGYASGELFSDDFGAYQEGYLLGTGLGYQVILPDPITWSVEAGLGYRSQQAQGALGVRDEELAARLGSDFGWALNDNVSLYNKSEVVYAASDTYLWNEAGLTANLVGNLAARASFRVDHHTDVPFGTEKTDTISRVGIVYKMK